MKQHILDFPIPFEINILHPPIKPSPYNNSSNKFYKLATKQPTKSPVSVLNELSQKHYLVKPKYTLYNHPNKLYLCRIDFAGRTFQTSTPKYHRIDIKNDAAEIALDFFSNLSAFPHLKSTRMGGDKSWIPVVTPGKSYVSALVELCQIKEWKCLTFNFDGPALISGFICDISIDIEGWLFSHKGSKTFKKKRMQRKARPRLCTKS